MGVSREEPGDETPWKATESRFIRVIPDQADGADIAELGLSFFSGIGFNPGAGFCDS
jgi:hypothetical protein